MVNPIRMVNVRRRRNRCRTEQFFSTERNRRGKMKSALLVSAAVLALGCSSAFSQGIIGGADRGSREGAHAAGPVGGIVGGVVGGVAGGVAGLLGVDQRPRFHDYVVHHHYRSYRWGEPVVVGAELPPNGVEYYPVPREYGATPYRYTVVDGRTVLVDPRTHRIVEVID
jgi:hypothetical protein